MNKDTRRIVRKILADAMEAARKQRKLADHPDTRRIVRKILARKR